MYQALPIQLAATRRTAPQIMVFCGLQIDFIALMSFAQAKATLIFLILHHMTIKAAT